MKLFFCSEIKFIHHIRFCSRWHQRHRVCIDQDVHEASQHRGETQTVLHVRKITHWNVVLLNTYCSLAKVILQKVLTAVSPGLLCFNVLGVWVTVTLVVECWEKVYLLGRICIYNIKGKMDTAQLSALTPPVTTHIPDKRLFNFTWHFCRDSIWISIAGAIHVGAAINNHPLTHTLWRCLQDGEV